MTRPAKITPEVTARIGDLYEKGLILRVIAKLTGVRLNTVKRVLNTLPLERRITSRNAASIIRDAYANGASIAECAALANTDTKYVKYVIRRCNTQRNIPEAGTTSPPEAPLMSSEEEQALVAQMAAGLKVARAEWLDHDRGCWLCPQCSTYVDKVVGQVCSACEFDLGVPDVYTLC